jgi:hypothetical protein
MLLQEDYSEVAVRPETDQLLDIDALSVLDQSRSSAATAAQAVHDDSPDKGGGALGYHRYWLAEHHRSRRWPTPS